MKRTCTLTGGKGCKLEQVQAMLMPGSKMEAAEEGAYTAHRPGNVEVQEQCFTEQPREFCFRC
jgi:hypothetical protein